jgi:hypothetical protein
LDGNLYSQDVKIKMLTKSVGRLFLDGENRDNLDGILKDSTAKPKKKDEGWGKKFLDWTGKQGQLKDRLQFTTDAKKKAMEDAEKN